MAQKLNRTDLENFFDYGIHVSNREVYMGSVSSEHDSGTDYQMAERIIKSLAILDKSDGPITIYMNNFGGCEYAMFAIYDFIRGCKNHITIKVFGAAMSAGAYILQAADTRIVSTNSRMMIHYGTWGFAGHAKDFDRYADENKILCNTYRDVLFYKISKKKKKFTVKDMDELLRFDTFLSAKEAVSYGLADQIISGA